MWPVTLYNVKYTQSHLPTPWDGDMTASFLLQYKEVDSSEYTVAESDIPWVDPGNYRRTTITSLSNYTEYEFSITTNNAFKSGSSSNSVMITSRHKVSCLTYISTIWS